MAYTDVLRMPSVRKMAGQPRRMDRVEQNEDLQREDGRSLGELEMFRPFEGGDYQ
jgi:hypothetical protein